MTRPLKKGDLVFVVDGGRRKAWTRGIVEEPIVSIDGRIRQALIRTNYGIVRRATANLAVLEIDGSNAVPDDNSGPGLRAGDVFETSEQPCIAEIIANPLGNIDHRDPTQKQRVSSELSAETRVEGTAE